MDTFESISEQKESRLGDQSGYNAGQHQQHSRCSSRASQDARAQQQGARLARVPEQQSRAASDAGEKKQMLRGAARA